MYSGSDCSWPGNTCCNGDQERRRQVLGREDSDLLAGEVEELCDLLGGCPVPVWLASSQSVKRHLLHYVAVKTGFRVPDSLGKLPVADEPVDVSRGDVEDHGGLLRGDAWDRHGGHVAQPRTTRRALAGSVVALWTENRPRDSRRGTGSFCDSLVGWRTCAGVPYSLGMPRMTNTPLLAAFSSVAACALLTVGLANPAQADVASKKDPIGDAPARLDIASVTYRNTTPRATVRVRVPELSRAGRAEFYVTVPRTDVSYVAITSIRSDATLRKRFVVRGNLGDRQLKCSFSARWNVSKNFVYMAVPRSCIPNAGDGQHYMRAIMSAFGTDDLDYAPPAQHLARD